MCDQCCSPRDLLSLAAPGDPRCLLRYTEVESYSERANWLRAGVLGANDGLVSVASIMLGVGAGNADLHTLLLSGLSALVAGKVTQLVVAISVHAWALAQTPMQPELASSHAANH